MHESSMDLPTGHPPPVRLPSPSLQVSMDAPPARPPPVRFPSPSLEAAMDAPPAMDSRRRAASRGRNARSRLGLKRTSVTGSPAIFAPVAPTASPAAQSPTPTATSSSPVPPQPPYFASPPGITQGPNSWAYPPGGFLNFIQQPYYLGQAQQQGENFHFVGQTTTSNPISPPPPTTKQGTSTNKTVNIESDEDGNNDANMPAKKRFWTHEEEERLASAWLNASKDPIKGNDKKGDTFWKEMTEQFNMKGNGKRTREINQLKIHWSRLKSSINEFDGHWIKVTQMHTSGYSDDMLEEEAQKLYANKFGKRFSLVHWWKMLKDEPKWHAQFEETEKNKNDIIDIPDEQSRPIGREAAKADRSIKRKKQSIVEGIVILGENIDKIVKVQHDRKVECEKVTEAQIKVAKEQKEAKMFEVYNSLLNQNTSQMSENEKANREKAIRKIEEKLFGD